MESQTIVQGKIIRKYKIPLDEIENLNYEYEKNLSKLQSANDVLAGNLKSELLVTDLIARLPIIHTLYKCMQDCLKKNLILENADVDKIKVKDYIISDAWINDMKEGEYQPPHTHNINDAGIPMGFSTVLFLKTPEIIIKNRKEVMGGLLSFIDVSNDSLTSFKPVVGDFYIFLANHQHLVLPFKTRYPNEIRRSMSFNYHHVLA
tara:strand:+ start:67 stop:681 length:615 start_codon:yes stop_codon:yes gene_type:complete